MYFFALWLPVTVMASNISGTWVQDVELQTRFNESRGILNQWEKDELRCANQKMSFESGILFIIQRENKCRINGKEIVVHPFEIKNYYTVLVDRDDVKVLEIADADGNSRIDVFYFVNKELFWSYYFGNDASGEEHFRIYYRKSNNN